MLGGLPADGRYRDLALTSYGGLAMDNGDYELAARIWLTLKEQAYWSESSATAQLGFPMSLEHMASRELALTNYRAAEATFEGRLDELKGVAARADDPAWVGGLLAVFAQPDADASTDAVMDEWRKSLGHTDWLEWLASEDVQELLSEWRQLRSMNEWLQALPDELATFDALATEQRRRAAAARELIDTRGLRERREHMTTKLSRHARADRRAGCGDAAARCRLDARDRKSRRSQAAERFERKARAVYAEPRRPRKGADARVASTTSKASSSGI